MHDKNNAINPQSAKFLKIYFEMLVLISMCVKLYGEHSAIGYSRI